MPLQKAQIVLKEAYYRANCIATRVPKGAYEDVLLYDGCDPTSKSHPNPKCEYMAVSSEDHKVG